MGTVATYIMAKYTMPDAGVFMCSYSRVIPYTRVIHASRTYCSGVLVSSVHERIFHLTSACEYSPRVTLPLARVYSTREWDVASERCRMYAHAEQLELAHMTIPCISAGVLSHAAI